jgi:putative endonuclease
LYKNRTGKTGEAIAKRHLLNKGLKFLNSNYRFEKSEIDLIFIDDEKKLILFCEVKTRRNKNFGEPEESINNLKMEHLRKAAEGFIMNNEKYSEHDLRFDVITIMMEKEININHIENAF